MEEIWKDIDGYEGYYQISNIGRVKSLARESKSKAVSTQIRAEKVMKNGITIWGYPKIVLQLNGKTKTISIHRLVAKHFVSTIDGKNVVNHIDGNKTNNVFTNLEWVTIGENQKHAYDIGLRVAPFKGKFGKNHNTSKPILKISIDGDIVARYECTREAEEELGFYTNSKISDCANGKRKTAYGFKWKYE